MDQIKHPDVHPGQNIAQLLAAGGSFSTLAAGLKEAGLIDTVAGKGPFTVFAPSDEAFKKLPFGAFDTLMRDKAKLKAVLSYHVVAGQLWAKELQSGDLATVQGSAVHVKVSSGPPEINGARVLGADIAATNGVIHVIDAVLLPKHVKLLAEAA